MSLIQCERAGADGKIRALPRIDVGAERSDRGAWLVRETKELTPTAGMTQQVTSDARAAQMIELAVVLTKCPDNIEAKATLARIANELLRTESDAIIDHAIRTAHTCRIAQTLRHAAESASERVEIFCSDVRAERLLFTIPILTAFEESIPESQFETALGRFKALVDLPEGFANHRFEPNRTVLLPTLFRFEELSAMPLSVVRTHATTFGTSSMRQGVPWHCSIAQESDFKRSPAFLRFAVGQRVIDHRRGLAVGPAFCRLLAEHVGKSVKRYLKSTCRVKVNRPMPFHQGLYSGMWLYQAQRLNQLARASRTLMRGNPLPEAALVIQGPKYGFELLLTFVAAGDAVGGRAYRLRSRPAENPQGCIARVSKQLKTVGINVVRITPLRVDAHASAPLIRRNPAHRMIALAI